jgi:hypothetical protein
LDNRSPEKRKGADGAALFVVQGAGGKEECCRRLVIPETRCAKGRQADWRNRGVLGRAGRASGFRPALLCYAALNALPTHTVAVFDSTAEKGILIAMKGILFAVKTGSIHLHFNWSTLLPGKNFTPVRTYVLRRMATMHLALASAVCTEARPTGYVGVPYAHGTVLRLVSAADGGRSEDLKG